MRDIYIQYKFKTVNTFILDALQSIAQSNQSQEDIYISSLRARAGEIFEAVVGATKTNSDFAFEYKDIPDAKSNKLRKRAYRTHMDKENFLAELDSECVDYIVALKTFETNIQMTMSMNKEYSENYEFPKVVISIFGNS